MIITSSQLAKACIEHTKRFGDAKKTVEKFKKLLKDRPVLQSSLPMVKIALHHEQERMQLENQVRYVVADKKHVTQELIETSIKKVLGEAHSEYVLVENPELIGGFVLSYQGHIYDFSIATIINKATKKLEA